MDKGINRIAIIISGIVLTFSLIYGLWYFNRDKIVEKKEDNSNVITENDKKDKDVKYDVKEIKLQGEFFSLLNNKYFISTQSNGDLAQSFSYYDLDGNVLGEHLNDMLHPGLDDKLYSLSYDETKKELTINTLINNNVYPLTVIKLDTSDYHPVYYVDDNGFSYFLGIETVMDGVDTFYKIVESATEIIKAKGYHFIGDSVILESQAIIYTHDPNNIVVEEDSKEINKKVGVFNFKDNKVIIDFDYDNIITIGNNNFIVNVKDKTTIVNSKLKALTLPYDFIQKAGSYYIVGRDTKLAVFDEDYKVLTDFEIPYYGGDYEFHPCCGNNNGIYTLETDKGIFIITTNYEKNSEDVYFLTKKNELRTHKIDNLNVMDVYFSFDETTRNYIIFSDEFELMYSINLDKYFKDYPYYELRLERYGDTLILRSQKEAHFFNYEDGEEINGVKDYELQFTESMKAVAHSNLDIGDDNTTVTFSVGDKEYKFVYGFFTPNNVFKKIDNKYYFFADSKILQITAK